MNLDELTMFCKLKGWSVITDGPEEPGHLHLINQSHKTIMDGNYSKACGISILYRYDPTQMLLIQNDRNADTETTKNISEITDEVIDTFLTYK